MRGSVLLWAIVAAAVVVLTGLVSAQEAQLNGTVAAPPSTLGLSGLPHTPLYVFIPEGGARPDIPLGETPASIACIYGVTMKTTGCPKSGKLVPTGGKDAIAVVEYGSYSAMKSDAAIFAKQWGLPAPSITEVCATGAKCPANNGSGWDLETALDVQWAHAMAPKAKIYVYEFSNDPLGDGAETKAANAVATAGGGEVSNSWYYTGGETWCGSAGCERNYDKYFSNPKVVFFASAGDNGAVPQYPSVSPNVVSAGGTFISRDASGNYKTETCWSGSGGGKSVYEPIPSYQSVIKAIVGTHRGTPDVSADADPNSGVAVYSSSYCGGWCIVGGTSASSPILAGITNTAGSFLASTNAELTKVYGEYGNPTEYLADFHDITVGSNGFPAKKGWDYCTGVGTPKTPKGE